MLFLHLAEHDLYFHSLIEIHKSLMDPWCLHQENMSFNIAVTRDCNKV